jgi:hypothetical protein
VPIYPSPTVFSEMLVGDKVNRLVDQLWVWHGSVAI